VHNLLSNVGGKVLTTNTSSVLGIEWQDRSVGGESIFSARINSTTINNSTSQLTNWTTTDPSYGSVNFNNSSGSFTVPSNGKYSISTIINYSVGGAILSQLGVGVNPGFSIVRTSPVVSTLISGPIPLLNVNIILVLSLRTILAAGQVVISGDVQLLSGDVIGIRYVPDGFNTTLTLGGDFTPGVIWSISKLS